MLRHMIGLALICWVGCSDDPIGPTPGPGDWVQVALGAAHACGLTDFGGVFCWGRSGSGQAGKSEGRVTTPARIDADLTFEAIAAGGETTCGISDDGTLYCWGSNALGQLGDGTRVDSFRPVAVSGGLEWSAVSVGTYHVCGIDAQDRLHCWGGDRWDVVLGYPGTLDCPAPAFEPTWPCQDVPLPDLSPGTFDWVEAGLYQTCAGTSTEGAVCWGTNDLGQLGTSTTRFCAGNDPLHPSDRPCSRSPVAPDGVMLSYVAPGATHTCGSSGGDVYCWGALGLNVGQLGNGSLDGSSAPMAVAVGGPWSTVSTSHEAHIRTFSCGVEQSGSAHCWGANRFGQLGSSDAPDCGQSSVPCRDVPTPVEGGASFHSLALGTEFACGLTTDGTIVCWGYNADGQLGDGTLTSRHEPAAVTP